MRFGSGTDTKLQLVGLAQACLVFWEVDEGLSTSIELLDVRKVERLQKVSAGPVIKNPLLLSAEQTRCKVLLRQRRALFSRHISLEMLHQLCLPATDLSYRPPSRGIHRAWIQYAVASCFNTGHWDRLCIQPAMERPRVTMSRHRRYFVFDRCWRFADTYKVTRWRTIAASDILIETALFAIVASMVYGLYVSSKTKALVVLAFGLRLL